ncbi:hypothetical protein [Stenotrophomonas maltophilia]|uniref:hypothetical protein n=1 Tax=Stenotrophomonas maltophilia TaxID=40324 RepID=UPI0011B1E270|nr:hypothetical protein [Stenotrophomonas maltophilia]
MKIEDIFSIRQGRLDKVVFDPSGAFEVVSATTQNNGVAGFTGPLSVAPINASPKDPVIAVARNGDGALMFATVHFRPLYLTSEAFALVPNADKFWGADKTQKLFAISAFIRKQRWRFGYGRKANGRLGPMEVDLGAVQAVVGSIAGTTSQPKSISAKQLDNLLASLPVGVTIGDLFDLISRRSLAAEDAKHMGAIPLVSTTENNNGVCGFVDSVSVEFALPGHTLSVAKNGRPMVSRVQNETYAKTSDMAALGPKDGASYSPAELAILAALIEYQGWRYSYGRKANWDRMGGQVLR